MTNDAPMQLTDPLMVAFFDVDDALEVRIDPDQVPDAKTAGILLADFSRHFAQLLEQTGQAATIGDAHDAMMRAFIDELNDPTDNAPGEIPQ